MEQQLYQTFSSAPLAKAASVWDDEAMKTSIPALLRLCGVAILAAASAACSGVAAEKPATVPAAEPAAASAAPAAPADTLMQQIKAEIGDAACDSAQQCHTIAIGNKACGGPESYLAWSDKRGDAAKLARLAQQYSNERKRLNTSSGRISTCSMVMDPGATCTAGRCVTAGGAGDLQVR